MSELPKCANGAPPVVRLALRREKCPRASALKVNSPESIVNYLKSNYGCEPQEWAVVVGLTPTSQVLGIHEVALGGMAQTMVDPKVVFAGLILMGANAFVFCHNHPSGSTQPSVDDVALTKTLKQAGELLSIRMVDHIIVSGDSYSSFVQQGLFR